MFLSKKTYVLIACLITINIVTLTILIKEKNVENPYIDNARHNTIVAVDAEYNGVSADLYTQVRPGNGLVLVNINDVFADVDTQLGARIAAKVAGDYALMEMSNYDVIFTIKTDAELVGGQSASSTMAAAVIASLLNLTLRENVILTGPIQEDGTLVEAGGIEQKAEAAKRVNASLFLVPLGTNEAVIGYRRERICANEGEQVYCVSNTKEQKETISERVGIPLIEVENIAEAMRYMLWST